MKLSTFYSKILILFVKFFSRLILHPLIAKKQYQELFFRIYKLGLYGMNYGRMGGVEEERSGILILKKIKRSSVSPIIIFDVGANIGEFSLMTLKLYNDTEIQIHAFEPSSISFQNLKLNLDFYDFIHLNNIGLGRCIGEKLLFNSGSKLAQVKDSFTYDSSTEKIKISSVDEYCQLNKITHIDYLKIDVEGFEMEVLAGASTLIEKDCINFIQFEFGHPSVTLKTGHYFTTYFNLLSDKYNIYRILNDGIIPIASPDDFEIYLGANYLACHKKVPLVFT